MSAYQPPMSPPPRPPLNIQEPGFSQYEVKAFSWRAWAKLAYIFLFLGLVVSGAFFLSPKIFGQKTGEVGGEILLQTRYQPVLWKDFGEVFEPMIKVPFYYPSEGFVSKEFLLDSGALVSSLPREEAKKMGLSLAKLPRSVFGGFGGTTSFAYRGEGKIKLGEQEVLLPLVFTEAAGTKPILGRSGFFEKYSIYFNSKLDRIEIRK
jgi:predicted aspartyl protease